MLDDCFDGLALVNLYSIKSQLLSKTNRVQFGCDMLLEFIGNIIAFSLVFNSTQHFKS